MDGTHRRGDRSTSTLTLCAVAALMMLGTLPMAGCEWINPTYKNPDNPAGERMTEEQFRDWYAAKKAEDEKKAADAVQAAKERAEADAARVKREAEQDAETERLRLEAERRAFEVTVAGIEGECALEIRKATAGFDNLSDQVGAAIRRIEQKGVEGLELVNRKHAEAVRGADEARREAMMKHAEDFAGGMAYFERKSAEFGMVDGAVKQLATSPLLSLVPWGGMAGTGVLALWQGVTGARRRREDEKRAAEAKLDAEKRVAQERIERAEALRLAEVRVREESGKAWDESAEAHEKAVAKRDADYVEGASTAKADAAMGALMTLLAAFVPPGVKPAGGGT